MRFSSRRVVAAALAALGLAAVPMLAGPHTVSAATTFTVTTAADPSSGTACPATGTSPCSLRAAVTAANTTVGSVVIQFAVAGPFPLSATGELFVNGGEQLTIQGAADGSTVINGAAADRVIGEAPPGPTTPCPTAHTSLTLQHVTISGGHASLNNSTADDGYGGGVDVNCGNALTVLDGTFSGNSAARGGGAIDDNTTGAVTLVRTTISGSVAAGTTPADGGGAIQSSSAANLTIVDSTLTGNRTAFQGGAIYAISGAGVAMTNDTISGNTASAAVGPVGGVFAEANAATTAANSIVAGNGTNCMGVITDGGHNLEDGTSCGFSSSAVNGDPKLDTLKSNGGPTMTMALKPGSPAIAAGDDTVCAAPAGANGLDQRSVTRPQGKHCDIGAFEVVATTTGLSAPATAAPGETLTLTATVTPKQAVPGQPAGTVTFLDGTTVLGTASLGGATPDTATFTLATVAAGSHPLSARFEPTPLFLTSTSAPVALAVAAAATATPAPVTPPPGVISTPNSAAAPSAGGSGLLGMGALGGGAVALRRLRRAKR